MNNELKHFGVLGMKWGKRKAKPVGTSLKSSKLDESYNQIVGDTR